MWQKSFVITAYTGFVASLLDSTAIHKSEYLNNKKYIDQPPLDAQFCVRLPQSSHDPNTGDLAQFTILSPEAKSNRTIFLKLRLQIPSRKL